MLVKISQWCFYFVFHFFYIPPKAMPMFLPFLLLVPILSCLNLVFLRLPRKDDIKFSRFTLFFFFVLFYFFRNLAAVLFLSPNLVGNFEFRYHFLNASDYVCFKPPLLLLCFFCFFFERLYFDDHLFSRKAKLFSFFFFLSQEPRSYTFKFYMFCLLLQIISFCFIITFHHIVLIILFHASVSK